MPYKNCTYANTAEVLNAIFEAEKIEKAILLGLSLGGMVCQPFIEAYPEKAMAFVAMDTAPFGLQYYSRFDLFCLRHVGAMLAPLSEKMIRNTIATYNAVSEEGRSLLRKMLAHRIMYAHRYHQTSALAVIQCNPLHPR